MYGNISNIIVSDWSSGIWEFPFGLLFVRVFRRQDYLVRYFDISRFFTGHTGHDPTRDRGPSQEVFKISRVVSGRVKSDEEVSRIGSSWVKRSHGLGGVRRFWSITGHVRSDHARSGQPDPTRPATSYM